MPGAKPEFKRPRGLREGFKRPGVREEQHRINKNIRNTPQVRVVGDDIEAGVYPIDEAIKMAEELGVDLVEIAPNVDPPVCKIIDYGKYLYELKKKAKEVKAKASKVVVKDIRFGPHTDEHDYQFKKNHAMKFLQEGSKVKAFVFFRGREIVFKEQGTILLLRFASELEEWGKAEQLPVLEGKKMLMVLAPKKVSK
ncbi:MAG: translation initiation factor IF-3 [Bacteroidetes bacterium]|nr:translation initiation factor IF-3 [Bacteroidota bacterium]MBK8367439.1 translation initiation factor IF-3 [Bacteroidota bacterium]